MLHFLLFPTPPPTPHPPCPFQLKQKKKYEVGVSMSDLNVLGRVRVEGVHAELVKIVMATVRNRTGRYSTAQLLQSFKPDLLPTLPGTSAL